MLSLFFFSFLVHSFLSIDVDVFHSKIQANKGYSNRVFTKRIQITYHNEVISNVFVSLKPLLIEYIIRVSFSDRHSFSRFFYIKQVILFCILQSLMVCYYALQGYFSIPFRWLFSLSIRL
jgi:hypothetical protein